MTVLYWKIPVRVTLIAPWVIPGDEPAGSETDIRLARTSDRAFAIPGSHVKGHLRAAMEQLVAEEHAKQDDLEALFGGESPKASGDGQEQNMPNRGRLLFADLRADDGGIDPSSDSFSVRVEIDPELHAARKGHLVFIECPCPFGTEVKFSGEIIANGGSDPASAIESLKLAAQRVFAIGGMKSVGFGRIRPGSWTFGEGQRVVPASVASPPERARITCTIDRPFLVNSHRSGGNMTVGSDVIPGGAIKGALANAWVAAGYAPEELSALRIGHAFPAREGGTPEPELPVPLSLSVSGGTLYCNLLEKAPPGECAHVFSGDWKPELRKQVRKALGLATRPPEKTGRSRTAIDRGTLGARYDGETEDALSGETGGMLFSAVAVRPDGHVWVAEISSDPAVVAKALGILGVGLPGLGKSGAVISCTQHSTVTAETVGSGPVNLCLLSDAALLDPCEIRNGAALHDAYARYFDALGFGLENFFSRESLRGGYLALRYPPEDGGYSPWLVTEPGSVFRLSPRDDAGLADILANGLPPAERYSRDWRKMPFLRENGYGAVARDVVDHAALKDGLPLEGGRP